MSFFIITYKLCICFFFLYLEKWPFLIVLLEIHLPADLQETVDRQVSLRMLWVLISLFGDVSIISGCGQHVGAIHAPVRFYCLSARNLDLSRIFHNEIHINVRHVLQEWLGLG